MEPTPTAFVPKPIRIIVVGAGISGIQFLKDATTKLLNIDVTVYDKNNEEGGTWTENRYPGYIQFNTTCNGALWDEKNSEWIVSLQEQGEYIREITVKCDVFVMATGRLNNWKFPNLPGLDRFEGSLIHTANWPQSLDYRGKDIAVIGNGASSTQCLARLAQDAGSIGNFIRGPTYLVPHVFSQNGEAQVTYAKSTIEKLESDPNTYLQFRKDLEQKLAGGFEGLWTNSNASEEFTRTAQQHMINKIDDPQALKALLPTDYKAGCRRFTPADKYMEALNQPNVELISSSIERVEGNAIITNDGKRRAYDMIVCGTGFEPYTPRFPIRGREAADLSHLWSIDGEYESYLAATVTGFPNFFVFNPPICPVNGSAYPGIERTSDYIIRVLDRLQKDNLKSICVKQSAQDSFNQWVQSRMHEMVWSGPCSSWYKLSNGKIIVPWPGTIHHYYAATEIVRWEDFDLEYEDDGQRFASFGNGITIEGFSPENIPWLY
ncbi:monooxygenase [Fusarium heterosporum]|uniref:Monooxygenase n=1 Tax=Fusarium heterosporum TaxID=42747 RepID=A0A8H5T3I1_FUSHE|nr:monooxygenase [Fusarium heterosporum]